MKNKGYCQTHIIVVSLYYVLFLFLWTWSNNSISVVSFKVMEFLGEWYFCFSEFSLGSNDNKTLFPVPRCWVTHLSRWVQYELCLRTGDWNAKSLVLFVMWLKSCSYKTAAEVSFKSTEFPTSAHGDTFNLDRRCCVGEKSAFLVSIDSELCQWGAHVSVQCKNCH